MGRILRRAPLLFWLLAAAARGEPVKEYSGTVNRNVGGRFGRYCPEELAFLGSGAGGGGAITALPLSNNTIVRGHAREGGTDFAVAGSTIFFGMNLEPDTEVLDIRVAMDSGDADIFAGPKLSAIPADYPFFSLTDGSDPESILVSRKTRPSLDSSPTWFLAVHGFLETDFLCQASWGRPDAPEPLKNGVPVSGRVGTGSTVIVFPETTRYYSCSLPALATSLEASLTGMDGDADLFVARVLSADPSNYDFLSFEAGKDERIVVNGQTSPPVSAAQEWFIVVHGFQETAYTLTVSWTGERPVTRFLRGDCNDDGSFDISDPVTHLGSLFLGSADPRCPAACDANGDDQSDISDAVAALNRLFLGAGSLPAPFPDCGIPEKEPALDCAASSC